MPVVSGSATDTSPGYFWKNGGIVRLRIRSTTSRRSVGLILALCKGCTDAFGLWRYHQAIYGADE